MAYAQHSLASLYETKLASIRENLYLKQGEYRSSLEACGFTVTCKEHPAKYEAAHNLIAEKGGVVLEVSQLLRGGNTFSVIVKEGERARTVRLLTDSLDEAIAFADAAQYLAK